ncbi:MAG: putative PurR-regulated permease PerM [Flavobacterium sp.]|jgi:predicted PurR-regulated permease PerM
MADKLRYPLYMNLPFILISVIAIFFILFIGQSIIVPLLLSFLFAIMLRPVASFMTDKLKFPNVISSMMAVLIFSAIIIGVFIFISVQISDMVSDFDKIERNVNIHLDNLQRFLKSQFNLNSTEQSKYVNEATEGSLEKSKEILGITLLSVTDTIMNTILVPIYMFLILLYRTHFLTFLTKLVSPKNHDQLFVILRNVKLAVKSYIVGLILETIFVSVLTSIGLMVIGVKYAILLGVITGILNLIPYIGILMAGLITIVASLTGSADISIVVGIIVVTTIVQFIDNNILVPIVVSSKVEVNAIASIVGIIIGGAIAGFSGMFLAIPIIAILKVIFDKVESLKAWGYLLGDDIPKTYEWRSIRLPNFTFQSTSTVNYSEEDKDNDKDNDSNSEIE